jgi:hypothetical protein
MPLYNWQPPKEPEYTLDPATGQYVEVKKPKTGQYVDAQGVATTYSSEGVMPYMNDGSLKPEYAGQYPGQVGVPDPSHVPVWSGGPAKTNPEKPPTTIAPTTEEALNYGAEIGRLQSAIDTLKQRIGRGEGDIGEETRKLISYSQRLAALANKAKGTPNPALTPAPASAPAPLDTSLLVGPAAANPPAAPPDYAKASDTNVKYAENVTKAAAKTKDKTKRAALIKRAQGYSAKAQTYGAKVTLKPPAGGTPNA